MAVYRLSSNGVAVSRDAFFTAVSETMTAVKAKGVWNGSAVAATEVEVEAND